MHDKHNISFSLSLLPKKKKKIRVTQKVLITDSKCTTTANRFFFPSSFFYFSCNLFKVLPFVWSNCMTTAASNSMAFELFTLPTQVDTSTFWTNLKENNHFVLQQTKIQKSGIMRSVLGTLQNV